MDQNKPWLSNKKWVSNSILSNAKTGHYFLWGFALVWNLLTIPIFLDLDALSRKITHEPLILAVFLFPLAGFYLIVLAVLATRRWHKFGPTPLQLDPFPGSIGGQVGGTIDTNIPFSTDLKCSVSLSCLYSYISGSGKNRSRSEDIKWQTEGLCHFEALAQGTRFTFRFDIPANLPASDIEAGSNYHLWRVGVSSQLDGADFNRKFKVPVFATAEQSKNIRYGTEDYHGTVEQASAGLESVADIRSIAGGVEVWFAAFQRPAQGILMSLFGAIFLGVGIGIGLIENNAPLFFSIIFSAIGSLIVLYGLNYLGKSLLVKVTASEVKTRRFLFGVPITSKNILAVDFREFIIKHSGTISTGNKTTVFYRLYAVDKELKKFPVAERLAGRSEAELMKDCFETYLR